MALARGMIKACLAAAMLCAAAAGPALGAAFSVHRGINLDIWTTWPPQERWGDPSVLLPFPEWRKSLGAAQLAALKAAGFDFVRIPVDPTPFFAPQTQALRGRLRTSVAEAVRAVNAAGLKAIVDMHLFPAGDPDRFGMEQVMADPATFDAYVEHVRAMAGLFAEADPALVAFEPMNEPVVDCPGDGTTLWPQRQKRLFSAARAAAPRLTLVLTGACYSSAEGLALVDPKDFPDANLLWDFHSYQPFLLTHQGASWAGDFIRYVTGLPYPPSGLPPERLDAALKAIRARIGAEAPAGRRAGMLAYLDEQVAEIDTPQKLAAVMEQPFAAVRDWAARNGVAPENILLGEFGMIRQEYGGSFVMPAASRAAYVKDMIGRAEAHGFAWSIWDFGGAFGVVEEFDGRKAEPDVLDVVKGLPR